VAAFDLLRGIRASLSAYPTPALTTSLRVKGFAPFDIQLLHQELYVLYAKQDSGRHDDVAGPGNGFVDVYDTSGHLLRRLIAHGDLNSPWGLVLAPADFGAFSGNLLVGNFGDGEIHAYDPITGTPKGQLMNTDGNPILINGLWALRFGTGTFAAPRTLVFTAASAMRAVDYWVRSTQPAK
jgi:uncharacterized protein (TIGR03118 family)